MILAAARPLPPAIWTFVYLAMGWGVIACYFEFAHAVSHRAMLPIVLGGLAYSIGAVFNLLHWPVIVPGTFAPTSSFTSSCWGAVWLITALFSR